MRRNYLAKLGEVISLSGGVRVVVSDLDAENVPHVSHREWIKLCPLVGVGPDDNVLRSHRDYDNSFSVVVTIDKYGASIEMHDVPDEHIPELTFHFMEHRRIPMMLRGCRPYQDRLRAAAEGIYPTLTDGWV